MQEKVCEIWLKLTEVSKLLKTKKIAEALLLVDWLAAIQFSYATSKRFAVGR